jgi:hypothetical protein
VNRKSTAPIPEVIVQLQRWLDQFRSAQPQRTKLPEPLGQPAVELARRYGIYPVAHPLALVPIGNLFASGKQSNAPKGCKQRSAFGTPSPRIVLLTSLHQSLLKLAVGSEPEFGGRVVPEQQTIAEVLT